MSLTPQQQAFYENNGYLVIENLVSRSALEELRGRVSEICEEVAERREAAVAGKRVNSMVEPGAATAAKPSLRKLTELAVTDPFFRGVAGDARILDIISALSGGGRGVALYSDQVFLKPAFCGSAKPLHQDNSYFKVAPHHAGLTCWLALDDATVENGCMHYIPGSHKRGMIPHKSIPQTPHLTPEGEQGAEVAVPIPAGAAIFHHLLVLHSSKANSSAHSRRAWALHYANTDTMAEAVKPAGQMLRLR